ncbi:glyoxalase [bacterium]|nr:MAG: glyoxalase [bacterium]
MLIQRVDSVLIFATDVARSVAWYRDVLGLPVRMHHGDFAVLDAGGVTLALHGGLDAPPDPRAAQTMPVLGVADYAAAKAQLEARGCTFTFENQTPGAVFGTFSDPDGNPLQIIQRRSA